MKSALRLASAAAICLGASVALAQVTSDHGLSLLLLDTPKPGSLRLFLRFQDPATSKAVGATPVMSDFTVALAQGQARVTSVRPASALGLPTVTIAAVDHSGSFKAAEANVVAALEHLAQKTSPSDKLGLLFFGTEPHSFPTRSAPADLKPDLAAARALPYENRTRLLKFLSDAIDRAAQEGQQGFREVILFTDGDEESGAFDWKDVERLAKNKAVRVSVVLLAPPHATREQVTRMDWLSGIRRGTGGFEGDLSNAKSAIAAIDAARADRDSWYVVDADVCGVKPAQGSFQSSLRVQYRQSQAFTGDASYTQSLGPEVEAACPGTCDPATCNGWHACSAVQCQPKACTASADCGPGAHCDNAVCAQDGPARGSSWPWIILAAAVVALGGIALALGRRKPVPTPTPEAKLPVVPTKPTQKLAAVAGGLEELPETHLVALSGPVPTGQKWRLHKRTTRIGTALENELALAIPQLSATHAELQLFPTGALYVKDCNSTNGTSVNGRRLAKGERVEMKVGDQLQLSSTLLLVIERPGVAAKPAPPPPPPAAPPNEPGPNPAKGKTVIYRGS